MHILHKFVEVIYKTTKVLIHITDILSRIMKRCNLRKKSNTLQLLQKGIDIQ